MSLCLHLQQCCPCFVHLVWMVLEMIGWWLCSCCFVGCYFGDLFNIARSILVQFLSGFFFIRLVRVRVSVRVHVVNTYNRIDTIAAWKKLSFILSYKSLFHKIDNLSIAIHAFANRILMSFFVHETLLPKYVKLSTDFREPPLTMEMSPFWSKHMYSVLSAFSWKPMPPATCRLLQTML